MCVNRYVKEYVYRVWHSGRQICTQDRFTVAGAVWIRVEADVKWAACSQEPLNTRKHCQCYSVPECVWLWPRDSLESWLNMHDYTSMNICLSRNSHCLLSHFLNSPYSCWLNKIRNKYMWHCAVLCWKMYTSPTKPFTKLMTRSWPLYGVPKFLLCLFVFLRFM